MRLDFLLGASVKQGFADRVALLLAHGASPNGRDFYNKRRYPENALLLGDDLIAKMLADHGEAAPSFSPGEELRVACLRGQEEQVRRLAIVALEGRDDEETLVVAAQQGNLRAVRLCLEILGVPVDASNDKGLTALHAAAGGSYELPAGARRWPPVTPSAAGLRQITHVGWRGLGRAPSVLMSPGHEAAAAQHPPGSGG